MLTSNKASADRDYPDLDLFTNIRARYQSIVEHLLAMENPNDAVLGNFKARHHSGAFLCRHLNCPRSAIGFDSVELWKQHEDSHALRFQCTDAACGFTGWTFRSRAALNKHAACYHEEEKHDSIPESLGASSRQPHKDRALFRLNGPSSGRHHPKNKEEGSSHEVNGPDSQWGEQQGPSDSTPTPPQRNSPFSMSEEFSPLDFSSQSSFREERRNALVFYPNFELDPPTNTQLGPHYLSNSEYNDSNMLSLRDQSSPPEVSSLGPTSPTTNQGSKVIAKS